MALNLRRATLGDIPVLERWDRDPSVVAATTDDTDVERAFGGLDWRAELLADNDVSYHLLAEENGRPVGAMQICDPHLEPTHYWGDIESGLRAIDIWIGDPADRGRGIGTQMMRLAHDQCFADRSVVAIVIDPLASNVRAISFYRRLGYVEQGRRMFGEDDCVVMRLTRNRHARGLM